VLLVTCAPISNSQNYGFEETIKIPQLESHSIGIAESQKS